MAFVTETGKTYRVTGSDIDAWLDYTPPGGDEHDPGQSNNSAGFSLSSCLITVVEPGHRVEEGYPKSGSQKAPYEVVKVTVEGYQGEYYAWVVYEGVVKVEEHTPPVEPPGPETGPDPTEPEPEPQLPETPDGQPGDVQIEVHAGQTVVIEVRSATTAATGTEQGATPLVSCPQYATEYFFQIRRMGSLSPSNVAAKQVYQANDVLASAVKDFQEWVGRLARANLRLLECLGSRASFNDRSWVCRNIDFCRHYDETAESVDSLDALNEQVRSANNVLFDSQTAEGQWCR